MDERRDLVDREELRRRIKANESAYDAWSHRNAMHLLDAMPAVECPRGWTRGEVLAELDADRDAVCEYEDTYTGKWEPYEHIRAHKWHPEVRRYDVRVVRVAPEPEWVPLTQLVGRTIDGCAVAVNKADVTEYGQGWWALHDLIQDRRDFPAGTLNLETGQVAVRPKAAT